MVSPLGNSAADWLTNPTMKNEPSISKVRHFITDTLHKSLEDVQDLNFKLDVEERFISRYDSDFIPGIRQSRMVPGSQRCIIKFRGEEMFHTVFF